MTPVFVVNNHTLAAPAYTSDPRQLQILAAKPQLGATRNWQDGMIQIGPNDDVRPAARKDFDFFRVSWRGYRLAPDPKADHSLFGRF